MMMQREKISSYFLDMLYIDLYQLSNTGGANFSSGFPNDCFGYVVKGTGAFQTKTELLQVREGEIIFIPRGAKYISKWRGYPELLFYSLNFSFQSTRLPFKLQTITGTHQYQPQFDKIYSDYQDEKQSLSCIAQFYILYQSLSCLLIEQETQPNTKYIEKALSYLDNNNGCTVSVPYLAKMCGLSESHFYTLFKQATGCTPVQYKNKRKCEQVINYLTKTDYTVESISEILHFSTPSFMRKVVRQYTGKTPRQIRNELRGL